MGSICAPAKTEIVDEKNKNLKLLLAKYENFHVTSVKHKIKADAYEEEHIKDFIGDVKFVEAVDIHSYDRISCIGTIFFFDYLKYILFFLRWKI